MDLFDLILFIFIVVLIGAASFNFIRVYYFVDRSKLTDEDTDEKFLNKSVKVGRTFVHGSEVEDFEKQPRRVRKHLEKEFQKKIKKGIIVAVKGDDDSVLGYIPRAEAIEKGII